MDDTKARRKRRTVWVALGTTFLLITLGVGLIRLLAGALGGDETNSRGFAGVSGDRIAVINVNGVIRAGGESSLLGGVSPGASALLKQIRSAERNRDVKAVILHINSPGGAAASSQEVYEAVMAARRKKKFVASMADVAASGGYYIASACDRIVANRASMTGSIGVIIASYNVSGLMKRYDVTDTTITSGPFKATGAPTRPFSDADRTLLQGLVNDTYEQFVADVAKGRGCDVAKIRKVADGRVMTGRQAKAAGLVDELGGFQRAVEVARDLARLPRGRQPNLYYMGRTSLVDQLLDSETLLPGRGAALEQVLAPTPLWLLAPAALAPAALEPTAATPPAATPQAR
ncbi:MAG: signal peptide peptidase SppA [Armatimonadetes bacterium]|nr:signal peptide peptidase SppA [Armatimonadota bacterium]